MSFIHKIFKSKIKMNTILKNSKTKNLIRLMKTDILTYLKEQNKFNIELLQSKL